LIAYSSLVVADGTLGTHLLIGSLEADRAIPALVLLVLVLLAGVLWNGCCNYLEGEVLDRVTRATFASELAKSQGQSAGKLDCHLYDRVWVHYRAHIEKYKNRHLSGLVTGFFWEWNVGSSLIVAALCSVAFRPNAVFGRMLRCSPMDCRHAVLLIPVAFIILGAFMVIRLAPWTHLTLAEIRYEMVRDDLAPPRISPEKSGRSKPAPPAPTE
jgi:hypothetical protein